MHNVSFDVFHRGERGYEEARMNAVWNGRVPARYPSIIVKPQNEADVMVSVKYAKSHEMKIGIRSGGHSWSASFLRDDGMLLDLSNFKSFTFDAPKKEARVQPAVFGGELNAALRPYRLIFPSGHCPTVGLGGFLLSGGFGWNSRQWGLGCENILAIDIVTADGAFVHADINQHPDLYWAAAGSGPGFFGVITCFYLRLHSMPRSIMTSRYILPYDCLDELLLSLEEVQGLFPLFLEVSLFVGHGMDGFEEKTIALCADTFAEGRAEAIGSLNILHNLLCMRKALKETSFNENTMTDLLQRYSDILDSKGRRYECDNHWFDASMKRLLPGIHSLTDDMPPPPSHMYMLWWLPEKHLKLHHRPLPIQANLWLTYYAISSNPALDQHHSEVVTQRMSALEELSVGIQLGDENLAHRPAKFMLLDNYRRLESVRDTYDVDRTFHSYMRIPDEFSANL